MLRVLWIILSSALLAFSACTNPATEQLTPVETLAIRLHSLGYVRTLDEFKYTLNYQAVPPNKIVVHLSYPPGMNSTIVSRVTESARGAVMKMADQQFQIHDLVVEISTTPLSNSELERLGKGATSQESGN